MNFEDKILFYEIKSRTMVPNPVQTKDNVGRKDLRLM